METRAETLAAMAKNSVLVRQVAQRFITGEHTPEDGPAYGHALLALVEEVDGLRADVAEALERQTAAIEELDALCEQQRETIEQLLVENDDLRARLYLQDRKAPNAERRWPDA
jgi:hypothetical protein